MPPRVLPEASARVLKLNAETFRGVVAESDMVSSEIARVARRRAAPDMLGAVLNSMSPVELESRLPGFSRHAFAPGDVILREGDPADRFHLLVQGAVLVTQRDEKGIDQTAAELRAGSYFGETGLIHDAPRSATLIASGNEEAVTYSCDREVFDRLVREAGGPDGDLALALTSRFRVAAA